MYVQANTVPISFEHSSLRRFSSSFFAAMSVHESYLVQAMRTECHKPAICNAQSLGKQEVEEEVVLDH